MTCHDYPNLLNFIDDFCTVICSQKFTLLISSILLGCCRNHQKGHSWVIAWVITSEHSRLDSLDLFDLGSRRSCCHPGAPASVLLLLLLFKVYVKLRDIRLCAHAPACSAECMVKVYCGMDSSRIWRTVPLDLPGGLN